MSSYRVPYPWYFNHLWKFFLPFTFWGFIERKMVAKSEVEKKEEHIEHVSFSSPNKKKIVDG